MKKIIILIAIGFIQNIVAQNQNLAISTPAKDTYHGVEITDEYRNLENLEDVSVLDWMKSQTGYTESIIKNISNRDQFLERIKKLYSKSKFYYGSPYITIDHQYFYSKHLHPLPCLRCESPWTARYSLAD